MRSRSADAGPALVDGTVLERARLRCGTVTLHAVMAGPPDGPLVILLHGFPEFWWGWRHQIGPLARAGFRVVAPDGRGYNLSDKPAGLDAYALPEIERDVLELAAGLGRTRFDLVGHDWGGIAAFFVAARQPERVHRLAILNAPHPDAIGPYLRRHPLQQLQSAYAGFFQLPAIPEWLLSARDYVLLARALTGSARPGTFTDADLARYREAWGQPGALTAMLNWYRALARRPRPAAGRVSIPTLIAWGRRDHALQPGLAEASLALCDRGEILWRLEASHWVQHEEPEAVNVALLAHLSG